MRAANLMSGLLAVFLGFSSSALADLTPADELASLKKEIEVAWKEDLAIGDNASEAERTAAFDRYYRKAGVLARRTLALAEKYPEAPEAPEALAWVLEGGLGAYGAKLDDECNAAYDLLAQRYLDSDAILPVVRIAWINGYSTDHAGAFLRAAIDRSRNLKVKGLACFSLGRHQQQLVRIARFLDDPIRGKQIESNLGPEKVRRVRAVNLDEAKREAIICFERTLKEFAEVQPMGKLLPTLGEQAEGALYRLKNLEIGCVIPDLEGEDVDGKPLKLADFRGKVVVIAFWATWCGPCMGEVPTEKALVERLKGRPFVLIGVNGDDDRSRAKATSAQEGITWRSFYDGGPNGPISTRWGVSAWPTVYLIDDKGVIRNENLRGATLDQAVESLVNEVEKATKPAVGSR